MLADCIGPQNCAHHFESVYAVHLDVGLIAVHFFFHDIQGVRFCLGLTHFSTKDYGIIWSLAMATVPQQFSPMGYLGIPTTT